MKTVVQPLPQAEITLEKLSCCVAFRRAYLIPTRQRELFSKHICLEIGGFRPIFVENRLVYPENEIVLVAEK